LPQTEPAVGSLARVAPRLYLVRVYYTEQWGKKRYRGERFVYHVMRYCPAGKRIKPQHRSQSNLPIDGRKPCKVCSALAQAWLSLPTVDRTSV
jgi:hypothetical protein